MTSLPANITNQFSHILSHSPMYRKHANIIPFLIDYIKLISSHTLQFKQKLTTIYSVLVNSDSNGYFFITWHGSNTTHKTDYLTFYKALTLYIITINHITQPQVFVTHTHSIIHSRYMVYMYNRHSSSIYTPHNKTYNVHNSN